MSTANLNIRISGDEAGGLGALNRLKGGIEGVGKTAGGLTSIIGNVAKGFAVFGLAVNGVQTLGRAVSGFMGDALEAQQNVAQLEAVLKSTGGAAGVTADMATELATAFSKVTKFSDDAVLAGENILLTFTGIGKDIFPQATESMLNMSQALGQDLKSSAIQLGKALNDPITGLTALRRVGVAFTDEQETMIKSMVAAGDVMGAQKLILQELEKEFGNSAKAAGETFGGKLTILKNQIGELKEGLGLLIIRGLTPLLPHIQRLVTWMGDKLPGAVERLVKLFRGPFLYAVQFVKDAVLTFIGAWQGDWTDDSRIRPLHRAIGLLAEFLRGAYDAIRRVIEAFQEGGWKGALEEAGSSVLAFGEKALGYITDTLIPAAIAKLTELAAAFVGWIKPMIGPALEQLGEWAGQIGDWILNTGIPLLNEKLLALATAFIAWAKEIKEPIIDKLQEMAERVGAWIADDLLPFIGSKLDDLVKAWWTWVSQVEAPLLLELGKLLLRLELWLATEAYPAIVAKLYEWALAFLNWVGDTVIPAIPGKLDALWSTMSTWMTETALPAIKTKLIEWATAFLAWVADEVVPKIAEKLDSLKDTVTAWMIDTALPKIKETLLEWATGFLDWIKDDVLPYLPSKLDAIITTIGTWITDTAGDIASKGAEIAVNLMNGIVDAIKSFDLSGAISWIYNAIKDGLKDKFKIWSPSQVMRDEVGEPLVEGIAMGIYAGITNHLMPAIAALNGAIAGGIGMIPIAPGMPGGSTGVMIPGVVPPAGPMPGATLPGMSPGTAPATPTTAQVLAQDMFNALHHFSGTGQTGTTSLPGGKASSALKVVSKDKLPAGAVHVSCAALGGSGPVGGFYTVTTSGSLGVYFVPNDPACAGGAGFTGQQPAGVGANLAAAPANGMQTFPFGSTGNGGGAGGQQWLDALERTIVRGVAGALGGRI